MKDDVFGLLDSIRSRENILRDMVANMESLKDTISSVEDEIRGFKKQLDGLINYQLGSATARLDVQTSIHRDGEVLILLEMEDHATITNMGVTPEQFFQFCAWGCELAGWKVEQR